MTKTEPTHFRLSFTSGELFWLLSVFGNLPPAFLGQPFAAQPVEETRQAILSGAKSLLDRNLIRPLAGSQTYQVEGGVAALLHWLCDAERVILLQRIQRDGSPPPGLAVCLSEGLALLVEIEPANYTLTLFENVKMLLPALTECLGLPAGDPTAPGTAEGEIPLPAPERFIPLAWKDPAAARAALEQAGIPSKRISQRLDWADRLSQLLWVSENEAIDFYLASAQQTVWLARPNNSSDAPITFSILHLDQLNQMLTKLFSSQPIKA